MRGKLGETIRAAMVTDEETHFRLKDDGRCALLRDDNLCSIQYALGEKALCNICRDHPRYRVYLPGRTEIGLGLCCEEAARMLLSQKDKITLKGGVSSAPPRETVDLLLFRQKLLDAAQDRSLPAAGRMRKVIALSGADFRRRSKREWSEILSSLEPLESQWEKTTALLREKADYAAFRTKALAWETEYEQLLVYFLLRHLLADEGRGMKSRAAFAVFSTAALYSLGAAAWTKTGELSFADRAELARQWSANIEYSDENMRRILNLLAR